MLGLSADAIGDRELAFGARPIQEIVDEWNVLAGKMAPLWAKYGANGTAKMEIEAEEARLYGLFKAMATNDGKAMTEAALKHAVAAHDDIKALVARHTTERAEFYKYEQQMEALQMQANRGQALLKLAANEPRGGL